MSDEVYINLKDIGISNYKKENFILVIINRAMYPNIKL